MLAFESVFMPGLGTQEQVSEAPVQVAEEHVRILINHPKYVDLNDQQLLAQVCRTVPGIVSRRGALVLPIVDAHGRVNRAMCVAVILGTK